MPDLLAITGPRLGLKLRLAGVPTEEATDPEAIEELIVKGVGSGVRVLIVQEDFRDRFSKQLVELLDRPRETPLLAFCPSFEEEESDALEYVAAVVRPAVGYEIRLE